VGEKDGNAVHPAIGTMEGEARVDDPGPICSVRGVRARLQAHGLRPSHRRGQNFLCHPGILGAVVETARLEPSDIVLEVGAGLGVLTEQLASRAGTVVAVELDRALCGLLETSLADSPNVKLVCGDILRLTAAELAPAVSSPFKVVANLPYYLTSPLLELMLLGWPTMSMAVIMVQEEVARRITAVAGGEGYGSLTVLVGYHAQAELVRLVPANAFWPRPEVRSAILRLVRHSTPPVAAEPDRLFKVVRSAFGQRRKQLRNSLTGPPLGLESGEAEETLAAAGIDARRRAEDLSLEEFSVLAQFLPR
jgi:16S rRNA (adenine1518-N6/adenine1519-N6)-dimethyltransferase